MKIKGGLDHDKKVKRVARQLRNRKSDRPVSLKKKVVSHQVPKPKDRKYTDDKIDISDLNRILEVDPEERTCVAEPGVTFSDLVETTMKYGLVPMIVPEFKTITIGGAVAGASLESMSFRYGGFHDTCLEYEVITGKGEVLTCTPDNENSLVFQMVHGTFGTLGIISKLKFRLIPSKPFVKVRFERFGTLGDFMEAVRRHFRDQDVDFMDGFIHSPDLYVINTGDFVDEAPYTHDYDWMRVFYKNSKKMEEDYLRTPDYYFRYNSGVTNVRSLPLRFLTGKFITSNESLRMAEKFHSFIPSGYIPYTVDLFIPYSRLEEFLGWYRDEIKHYPLWVVPYRRVRNYEWLTEEYLGENDDELILDLAIYGMKRRKDKRNYYRVLEEELMRIGGIKTLISSNYYSESEFWSIWNRDNYFKVKQRTDPDNIFRDLYDKTCVATRGIDRDEK